MAGLSWFYPTIILDNVISMDSYMDLFTAITVDGELYTCGDNYHGRIGSGKEDSDYEKNPVKILDNVKSAKLDWGNCAAITTDGELYMWGENSNGQLGNGDSGYGKYSFIPIKINFSTEESLNNELCKCQ